MASTSTSSSFSSSSSSSSHRLLVAKAVKSLCCSGNLIGVCRRARLVVVVWPVADSSGETDRASSRSSD
jgi:hypothetical protein